MYRLEWLYRTNMTPSDLSDPTNAMYTQLSQVVESTPTFCPMHVGYDVHNFWPIISAFSVDSSIAGEADDMLRISAIRGVEVLVEPG